MVFPVVQQVKTLRSGFFRRELQVHVDRVNADVLDSSDGGAAVLHAVDHEIDFIVISNTRTADWFHRTGCATGRTCQDRRSFVV